MYKGVLKQVQDKFTTDDDCSNWFIHQFPTKVWHDFQTLFRKCDLWKCVMKKAVKKEEERSFKKLQYWFAQ